MILGFMGGDPQRRMRFTAEQWRLTVSVRLSDAEMLAVLASHAARHGCTGPDLAPAELYDRIAAFLWTYGCDAVQDTLTLPSEAVGWARRQLDSYRHWLGVQDATVLVGRPRRRSPRPLAPE